MKKKKAQKIFEKNEQMCSLSYIAVTIAISNITIMKYN